MAVKPLSLRAYAAWRKSKGLRGGSLEAVRRAIQSARLVDSLVTVDGVQKVSDPEAADREWEANTEPGRGGIPGFTSGEEEDDQEPPAIVQAAARLKAAQADLAELTVRKRAGDLVDAEEVQAGFVDLCTTARNKLLGLPNAMRQEHPDAPREWLATLDRKVREYLEELASE